MKSFRQHLLENSTGNLLYLAPSGANFAVDRASTDFDVEDWAEKGEKMEPWEVKNAKGATTRRTHRLRWMKAASAMESNAVIDDSLPLTPDWQSSKR